MSSTQKFQILQDCPLCQGMSDDEVSFAAYYVQVRGLQRDEFLFQEHQEGEELYYVSGEVDLLRGARTFARLAAGDLVGELAFLGGTSRTMSAVCKALTTVVILSREAYEQLAGDDCALALKMMENVAMVIAGRLKYTTKLVNER
jgi:CRP-like cAMP-binding protein